MDKPTKHAITEALTFLDSIEGHGYGGEARFENARRGLQVAVRHNALPRHDLAAQVKRLGADSLLPPSKR